MKKVKLLCFLSAVLMLLSACGEKRYDNHADMLKAMKEEKPAYIHEELIEVGFVQEHDQLLLIASEGSGINAVNFYAGKFNQKRNGKYELLGCDRFAPLGAQIYYLSGIPFKAGDATKIGSVILCNNEKAKSFHATCVIDDQKAWEIEEEVDQIPWIYSVKVPTDLKSFSFDPVFYDAEGKEITN